MRTRRSKFAPPTLPRGGSRSRTVRNEVASPTAGFHPEVPPQNLPSEASPFMENFAIEEGYIRARDGLTEYSSAGTILNGEPVAALGYVHGLALGSDPRAQTVAVTPTRIGIGRSIDNELTSVPGPPFSLIDAPALSSNETTAGSVSIANTISSTTPSANYVAIGVSPPMLLTNPGGSSSYVTFDGLWSVESFAHFIHPFDDRLVVLNTSIDGSPTPLRVRWSVRGNGLDFSGAGAGFEDLRAMEGTEITGVGSSGDLMYVFSGYQVWVAQPRRDDYAFDFDQVPAAPGTVYQKSIANTPLGLFYVTADHRIYLIVGTQAQEVSPRISEYLRDNIANAVSLSCAHNPETNSLLLAYAATDNADDSVDHMLELYLDTLTGTGGGTLDGVWAHHTLGVPATTMAQVAQEEPVASALAGFRNKVAVGFGTSGGTVYYMDSDSTLDADSVITCRYQFPPLQGSRDHLGYEAPTELHVDYRAASAASLEIRHSVDQGGNWNTISTYALSTTSSYDSTAYMPVTAQAAPYPMLEFRGTAGVLPDKIGRTSVTLRSYTGVRGGGR